MKTLLFLLFCCPLAAWAQNCAELTIKEHNLRLKAPFGTTFGKPTVEGGAVTYTAEDGDTTIQIVLTVFPGLHAERHEVLDDWVQKHAVEMEEAAADEEINGIQATVGEGEIKTPDDEQEVTLIALQTSDETVALLTISIPDELADEKAAMVKEILGSVSLMQADDDKEKSDDDDGDMGMEDGAEEPELEPEAE